MNVVETRLSEMGLTLPDVATPLAAYVPAVQSGDHVYTSGQLPLVDGALPLRGKVGSDLTADEAADLARVCVLNALAAVKAQIGTLDRISRIVKVVGFVASDPKFSEQPAVMNGASELLQAVLGEAGVHARSAVGVAALPLNAPVEVELLVEVGP